MNESECQIFPLMSAREHELYRSLYGIDAVPDWLEPADTPWVPKPPLPVRVAEPPRRLLAPKRVEVSPMLTRDEHMRIMARRGEVESRQMRLPVLAA